MIAVVAVVIGIVAVYVHDQLQYDARNAIVVAQLIEALDHELQTAITNDSESSLQIAESVDSLKNELAALEYSERMATDELIPKLTDQLLADDSFQSAIVQAVSTSSTDGFLREDDYQRGKAQLEKTLASVSGQVEKLVPVYDAIDVKDKENALAIPLIRKDITELSEDIEEVKSSTDKRLFTLHAEIATEINRVYDLGKWFLGLVVAACVLPIIAPLLKRRKQADTPESEDETHGEADA